MRYRLTVMIVLALALAAAPAFAQKVYVDYDKAFDMNSIKTFSWAETPETSLEDGNSLLHSRVVNAIEHYLTTGGLQEVKDNPDVYVTYHTSTKEQMNLNTTNFGYGYPGAWGWGGYYGGYGAWGGGMSSSSTTVSTYELGTLVVDVWSRESEKLIWRGTAADMTVSPNPDKMGKRIDKALAKIVKKWQKMKEKAGK